MNTLKTGLLLAFMGALVVGIGAMFGRDGMMIGLVVALVMQAVGFFQGHKIAISYAKAQPLPKNQLRWLHEANQEISRRAGMKAPTLYISPDPQPNAFAAGRNPSVAVVCFNRGLIDAMRQDEVTAVLAHEIAHIRNRDSLIMTVTAAFASFITFAAHLAFIFRGSGNERNPLADLFMIMVAPIAATVVQLAISRTREFAADRTAAELMGDARPMMSALATLDRGTAMVPSRTAEPATAHMYIASPFAGGGLTKLFMTHPPMKDRIAALQSLQLSRTA
jgi:heat shock protein HtpX